MTCITKTRYTQKKEAYFNQELRVIRCIEYDKECDSEDRDKMGGKKVCIRWLCVCL